MKSKSKDFGSLYVRRPVEEVKLWTSSSELPEYWGSLYLSDQDIKQIENVSHDLLIQTCLQPSQKTG